MSEDTFHVVITLIVIAAAIGLLAIAASVMRSHPAMPWFGFGALFVLVIEAVGYFVYRSARGS
jgi:hypothetical protein